MTNLSDAAPDTAGQDTAPDPVLHGQRVAVRMADGSQFVVTTTNADRVRYDLTAPRHKWPDGRTAPFLWATFCAYNASKREGRTTLTFEQFTDAAVGVDPLEVTDEVDGVPPTR